MIRTADAIAAELSPEMREAFDAADRLLELEARYLARHLTADQLTSLYVSERTTGDLLDVVVALRACQIADGPMHGPPARSTRRGPWLAVFPA